MEMAFAKRVCEPMRGGVCETRLRTKPFSVRGRLSAFSLCFEWALFVDLRRFRRFFLWAILGRPGSRRKLTDVETQVTNVERKIDAYRSAR